MEKKVCYIKNGKLLDKYEEGVETDKLAVFGTDCEFVLSLKDFDYKTFEDAKESVATLGEGWECPDRKQAYAIFDNLTEIKEKAAELNVFFFEDVRVIWTREECNPGEDAYELIMSNGDFLVSYEENLNYAVAINDTIIF